MFLADIVVASHFWLKVSSVLVLSGVGKTHKDAASVRATNSIPASCGIYYFEVRIVSKGRDGYDFYFLCVCVISFYLCLGYSARQL